MNTDDKVETIRLAELRVEIASAKLGVAANYTFVVGMCVGLFAWKVLAVNGWISFTVAAVAFYFADYSYSKEYRAATDALERLI